MLSIRVGKERLVGHGPVTVEYGEHGSEAASWETRRGLHPRLRGNAVVKIYDCGVCVWRGTLNEPGADGAYTAKGLWHQARTIPALDAGLNHTTVPNTAVDAAITRGEVAWTRTVDLGSTAKASTATELTLEDLLNWTAAELAQRWWVDGTGAVKMAADPTVPQWVVPHAVAGRGLAPGEDEFATHLVGRYLNAATNTYLSATVGSGAAATEFGRRTVRVDLTPLGGIDATRATSVLNGMFLRAGARMGWSEGLDLAYGQITNSGGTPASLAQIQSLQMVRLAGTVDVSKANMVRARTDIVTRSVRYTDDSRMVTIVPFGYAPRNLDEVLTLAVTG